MLLSVSCATAVRTPAPSTPTPTATATMATASAPPTCVQRTFARLTPEERVGQLFMLGLAGNRLDADTRAAIVADHFGSVWYVDVSTGGAAPIRSVADAVQSLAGSATGGIRFFVAANQEGGEIQALRGPGFSRIPSAVQQGEMSAAALESAARRWGAELRAAGVNFDFAPVYDVVPAGTQARNQPIGALDRNYGTDDATVSEHAGAFVRGMTEAGVATSAKHYPGLGRVTQNTDSASGVTDTTTTESGLGAFSAAVRGGVPFVMVSLATYDHIDPNHVAALSPIIVETILRNRLGFRGVVLSDSLNASAVEAIPPATRALDFLEAGGDMLIAKTVSSAEAMFDAIVARTRADSTFAQRVNDAVMRVLAAKSTARLLPC